MNQHYSKHAITSVTFPVNSFPFTESFWVGTSTSTHYCPVCHKKHISSFPHFIVCGKVIWCHFYSPWDCSTVLMRPLTFIGAENWRETLVFLCDSCTWMCYLLHIWRSGDQNTPCPPVLLVVAASGYSMLDLYSNAITSVKWTEVRQTPGVALLQLDLFERSQFHT